MSLLLKDFWFQASPEKAKEILVFLSKSEDKKQFLEIIMETDDLRDYFISYAWILRNEPELIELLNQEDLPLSFLLNFIYHGLGSYIKEGNTDYIVYFSRMAKHISANQSLRLLIEEDITSKDPALKIQLLANLDAKAWEVFFNKIDEENLGMDRLIHLFTDIPKQDLNRVFYRNPTLYGYMRMVMVLSESVSEEANHFLTEIEILLEGISVWEIFAKQMKNEFPPEVERTLQPKSRNKNRLSILLHELINTKEEDRTNAMDFLLLHEAILDENELRIITHALKNYKEGEIAFF